MFSPSTAMETEDCRKKSLSHYHKATLLESVFLPLHYGKAETYDVLVPSDNRIASVLG